VFTHELTPRPPMLNESGRVESVESNSIDTHAIHQAIRSVAVRDIYNFVEDAAGQAVTFKSGYEIREMSLYNQRQVPRPSLEFSEHREGRGDVLVVAQKSGLKAAQG
jgi:hypothetical protein